MSGVTRNTSNRLYITVRSYKTDKQFIFSNLLDAPDTPVAVEMFLIELALSRTSTFQATSHIFSFETKFLTIKIVLLIEENTRQPMNFKDSKIRVSKFRNYFFFF